MTTTSPETAQRAASRLRLPAPWELFGQRVRRFEAYFDGRHIETVRGPLVLEGVGLRIFRPKGAELAVGFQATSDLSPAGLERLRREAEELAGHAVFPARAVELPSHAPRIAQGPEVCSVPLWDRPTEELDAYVHALLSSFDGLADVVPSFGSVKATLVDTSIANSEGLSTSYVATEGELELAVKSFGGPEGAPPGEYWVTREMRQLDRSVVPALCAEWAQRARDVRRAKLPPSGSLPVGLPPPLINEILPGALALRFTGAGRLTQIAAEEGTVIASPTVTILRDPTVPWATRSAPVDDEGTPAAPSALIADGAVGELAYDALHAASFDHRSNGAATRRTARGPSQWYRFTERPAPSVGTLSVRPGTAGAMEELLADVEDGVWVDQLGWPVPDPRSGAFGGELRIGYRIRHGKLAEPLRGGTVGGLVFAPIATPSLLGRVRAIGSRAELVGRTRTPPMVVDGLTIGSSA